MSDTIFQQTPVEPTQVTTPTIDLPQEVVEFVGEGKKYATPVEALKSVPHAQKHIQSLEEELQAAREELAARKTAEQLLDEIKSGITQPPGQTTPSSVDPDMIAKTVSQVIEKREMQKTAQQNISNVIGAFTDKFGGEHAEAAYVKLAQENGMSVQHLNSLAAVSPAVVLKLAGIDKKQDLPVGKITSSVNTDGLKPTNQEISARVTGKSTKDLVSAWKAAGEKVRQRNQQ